MSNRGLWCWEGAHARPRLSRVGAVVVMTLRPGQLMSSPLGRPIRLVRRDPDGRWVCRYLDTGKLEQVELTERALIDGFMRRAHRANWCAEEE